MADYYLARRCAYRRVIPRDLFNESKLLKCLGKLSLLHVDEMLPGLEVRLPNSEDPFYIAQAQSSGDLRCLTVRVLMWGKGLDVFLPLNDRDPWPLMCRVGDEEDDDYFEIAVFDDDGNVTAEFSRVCQMMAPKT